MNDERLIWEAYTNSDQNYVYRGMDGEFLEDVKIYGLHPKSPNNYQYNELTWPEFSQWQTKWERQDEYEDWDDYIENTEDFPMEAIEERLYFTPDESEAVGYAEINDNPVLLRVNKKLVSWNICPKPYSNHWYTYESIQPENIEIKRDNKWVSLNTPVK